MRVLQLCHKVPYPTYDGGSIAMHQLTQGMLDRGIQVRVFALHPSGFDDRLKEPPAEYARKTDFEAVSIDTRVNAAHAFLNLFSRRSYNIERFRSAFVSRRLEAILKKEHFDIILLEGLYLTPYIDLIRRHSPAVILYRAHNIEHFIWRRMAAASRHPLRRPYLRLLASRLEAYEKQVIHHCNGLIAITENDQAYFRESGYEGPSVVIPVGVDQATMGATDVRQEVADIREEPCSVFHLGSMDWRPNREGLTWFLEKVWPLVVAGNPDLKFYLAGRNIPSSFGRYSNANVCLAGNVPDAYAFMRSKKLMVVPLLSGGGMRVKIVEGMAAGKTIVTTQVGAEGTGCVHGQHLLIAHSPEQMAYWILHCFSEPDMAADISLQARQYAETAYDLNKIIDRLITFYKAFCDQ